MFLFPEIDNVSKRRTRYSWHATMQYSTWCVSNTCMPLCRI